MIDGGRKCWYSEEKRVRSEKGGLRTGRGDKRRMEEDEREFDLKDRKEW